MSEVIRMQLYLVSTGSIVLPNDLDGPGMLVAAEDCTNSFTVRSLVDGKEKTYDNRSVTVLWKPGCPPAVIPLSPAGIEVVIVPIDHLAYLAKVAFGEMIAKNEPYMQCLSESPIGKICFIDDKNLTFRLFDQNAFRLEVTTFNNHHTFNLLDFVDPYTGNPPSENAPDIIDYSKLK